MAKFDSVTELYVELIEEIINRSRAQDLPVVVLSLTDPQARDLENDSLRQLHDGSLILNLIIDYLKYQIEGAVSTCVPECMTQYMNVKYSVNGLSLHRREIHGHLIRVELSQYKIGVQDWREYGCGIKLWYWMVKTTRR